MFFNRNKQETKKETIVDLDSLQSIESMRDVLAYLMETNKDHFFTRTFSSILQPRG